ncbi:MAG: hypothetical protein ACK4WC_02755 [Rubrimonas sp.]
MSRSLVIVALLCLGAGPALSQAPVCLGACSSDAPIEFTVRGGLSDALTLGWFTPRSEIEALTGVEAGVSAFGFNFSGAYLGMDPGADRRRVAFGATYGLGALSVGGAVSFGLEEAAPDASGAASLGVTWDATPAVSLGGSLGYAAPDAPASDGVFSAGVKLRLDF